MTTCFVSSALDATARRAANVLLPALAALSTLPATTDAQLITPKTVPVAQGDQFMVFPTARAGMGGVSIAASDSLLDPWVNPAKAARVGAWNFYGAPILYSISADAGSARTLPVGAMGRSGSWAGGFNLALQQLDKGRNRFAAPATLSERSTTNQYAAATAARRFDQQGVSVGASAFWAGLTAMDGVDMLYAGSQGIDQFGKVVDFRVGLTKDWRDDRSLEVLLLHNRVDMTHDVTYTNFGFGDPFAPVPTQRVEHNQDRTNTWGLHLEYERPLATAGWRIGWMATGNRHSHPKIPNYEIMSIPRDPGTTYAYNLGIGLARKAGPAVFGVDVIYEPMWSDTWADAARDTATAGGGIIPRGGRTVENDFRFSNAIVRLGVAREAELGSDADRKAIGVQFGVAMKSYDYRLEQVNHVQRTARAQSEDWVEWTPGWGLTFRFPELTIHYNGRYTTGVGRPGVATGFAVDALSSGSTRGGGIIAAPSGPLTLDKVRVLAHQVSFSLPMK